MGADMLRKGLDDALFAVASTCLLPSYYSVEAVPQLPGRCRGWVRRRNDGGLEAMARYHIGT